MRKKRYSVILFLLAALVIFSFYLSHTSNLFQVDTKEYSADSAGAISTDGRKFEQVLPEMRGEIRSFSLLFRPAEQDSKETVTAGFMVNGRTVQSWIFPAGTVSTQSRQTFTFNQSVSVKRSDICTLTLTGSGPVQTLPIVCIHNENGSDQALPCSLTEGGNPMPGQRLCFQIRYEDTTAKNRMLLCSLITFFGLLAVVLFHVNELAILSGMLVIFAVFWSVVFPVGMAPDEAAHFYRAYEVASGNMTSVHDVIEGQNGDYLPQGLDQYTSSRAEIDPDHYQAYGFSNIALYSPVCYIPQAVGIRIARCFTRNVQKLFYAARIGSMTISLMLCVAALILIPFGKRMLFLLMLFPMSMQEIISAAADGVTIGLCFFLTAYILYLLAGKKEIARKDCLILTASFLILSQYKIIYILMILLLFTLSGKMIGTRKKRIYLHVILPAAAILCNLVWLSISSSYLIEFNPGVNTAGQLNYVLHHPFHFIGILENTLTNNAANTFNQMIGANLGWLNVNVAQIVTLVFTILLFYEWFHPQKGLKLSGRTNFILILIFALTFLAVYASLYLQWTPVGEDTIIGVQGRYFLPVLPLLIYALVGIWSGRCKNPSIVSDTGKWSGPAVYPVFYIFILTSEWIVLADLIHFYLINGIGFLS
jgi:uncharacterized membrane protein